MTKLSPQTHNIAWKGVYHRLREAVSLAEEKLSVDY